jgi:hypothetical protein
MTLKEAQAAYIEALAQLRADRSISAAAAAQQAAIDLQNAEHAHNG